MLDERKAEILRALVEEHIRTGEPVSSRGVLEAASLSVSAATVRNDLAVLEADGYVVQPHTSAGRLPTARAYRYYVDHLARGRLRSPTRVKIHGFFANVHHELGRLLQATSDLLAELTRYPAVVVGPGLAGEVVRGVHLVQLGSQVILVVLVTDSGRVSQDLVRLQAPLLPAQVQAAEQMLQMTFDQRRAAAEAPALIDGDVPGGFQTLLEAALAAADRSEEPIAHVYVGGTSQMAAAFEDIATIHRMLELLEREAKVLALLAGAGTNIRIGEEVPLGDDMDIAVVSTGYRVGGRQGGRVGVIGPMRMDYRRTISVVEEVGEGLAESLGA